MSQGDTLLAAGAWPSGIVHWAEAHIPAPVATCADWWHLPRMPQTLRPLRLCTGRQPLQLGAPAGHGRGQFPAAALATTMHLHVRPRRKKTRTTARTLNHTLCQRAGWEGGHKREYRRLQTRAWLPSSSSAASSGWPRGCRRSWRAASTAPLPQRSLVWPRLQRTRLPHACACVRVGCLACPVPGAYHGALHAASRVSSTKVSGAAGGLLPTA